MPSLRRPRGTYNRPTGDWYSDKLCSGAWYIDVLPAVSQYLWIGLYNDSTQGDSLYVLTISGAMDGANVMAGVVVQGTLGTEVAACVNVNPSKQAPPGKIYARQTGTPGTNLPQAVPANTAFLIGTGFAATQFTPQSPTCILPPGYSCFLTSDFATADGGASFWYVPLQV